VGTSIALDEARLAWAHLSHVLERDPDNLAVNDRLSRVMVNMGLLAEAEPYLVRAAEMRPELHVLLARIYAEQHRAADARREAALARDHLASQVEQSPDNSIRRLQLANALLYLDDYEAARDVLHDSSDHAENELIRRRLREIYVSWADADLRKSRSHEDYLDRLSMALRDDPTNLAAVARVVAVRRQFPELRARTDEILDSLHFDHLPPPVHLLLATTAIERSLPIVARRHLEEAIRLQPDYPEAANNLAWLLAHAEPKDLPRALDLVNAALVKFPRHPMLLETRGRVLLLSERWEEARVDLETVAFVKQSDTSLHEALATCYEQLGMTEHAERERKLAGSAKSSLPSGEGGER
jgi:predicted Zn-dependent protease